MRIAVGLAVGLTAFSPLTGIWLAAATPVDASRTGFQADQSAPELQNSLLRRIQFQALAYTSAIASDVGKAVVGAESGDSGTLVSYDNTNRQWWVLADDAADLFDTSPEVVSVTAGTGSGTATGTAELGYAPESTSAISTSLTLNCGGTTVVGSYTDEQGLTCSLSGTFTPSTGAVALTGSAGDFDITVTLTLSAGVLSGSYPTGGITVARDVSGSSVETRDVSSMVRGAAVVPTVGIHVDGRAGNDTTGDGTSSNPYATLAKAETEGFGVGDTLRIARGTRVREGIIGGLLGITVEAYGVGPRPVVDAYEIVAGGSWSKTGGRTNVYENAFTPDNDPSGGLGRFCILEDGIALRYVADVATCDSTAGSYYAPQTDGTTGTYTVYIHPRGSTDPTSDGKVYEVTSRSHNLEATGSSTFRSIMGRGCLHDNGGLVIRSDDDANDTFLIDDCWQVWGGKHNFYDCGTKVGTESTHGTRRCVAFGWMPVETTSSAFVSYRNTITDQALRPVHYDCAAIAHPQADVVTQAQCGAYISHLGGTPGGNWAAAWLTDFGQAYAQGSFSLAGTHDKVMTNCISERSRILNNATAHIIISGGAVTLDRVRIYNHVAGYANDQRAVRCDAASTVTAYDCITVMAMASNNAAWALQGTADIQRCIFEVANRSGTVRHVRSLTVALALTQSNNVYNSSTADAAWRLDVAGSATTSSDYNAVNAALFVQESSGASARVFPTYVGDQASYDQNSTSTMPSYDAEADANRPVFIETAGSLAARGFAAGPAPSAPGGAGWSIPTTYAAALAFIDSL